MAFQVSTLSQKDFVIIQITDTHLLEYPHLEFVGMQPEQSFRAVIDLMRQQHPRQSGLLFRHLGWKCRQGSHYPK